MVVAITGIGIVSALGAGQEENRRRMLEGKSGVAKPHILPTTHTEWPVGEVRLTNEELASMLGFGSDTYSRNILLGMAAIREAIEDAGISDVMRDRIPLVNGSTVGGMDLTEAHYAEWIEGKYDTLPLIRQHEVDFTTREMVRLCGLQFGVTVSTACSSALNAIMMGAAMLRCKSCNRVIVGGTEALTRFHLNGFASLGILSKTLCRPFQNDRDGINLGEGAAYLVLENADTAMARKAKIHGYLAGYGNACDAYHETASSPEGTGAFLAMDSSLKMADIAPEKIEYINAHGTATPNNDASELRAFERLFGSRIPRYESTKPLTGHTTSASGSIEALFTLFRMKENGYGFALCNAFGFGGNDSSIVLSSMPVSLPEPSSHMPRIVAECRSAGELDYKKYISPMQARRMTHLMRQLIAVACNALDHAQLEIPDAIMAGTRFGGMVPTMQLLNNYVANGEENFSPAQFMNSTHNCAATMLARFLGCKGYNNTIVSSESSLGWANSMSIVELMTARRMRTLLVCSYDEVDDEWNNLMEKVSGRVNNEVIARVLWLDW